MKRTPAALCRLLPCVLCLFFFRSSFAKHPAPGVPAEGTDNSVPFVSEDTRIPADTLIGMYRKELGKLFKEEDAQKYLAAHETLETYFDSASGIGRKRAVKALEAEDVDIAILGRLARLRVRWPALQSGIYYVNEQHGPYAVRYYLGIPTNYDRTRAWPLVVTLGPVTPFLAQPPPDAAQVSKLYNRRTQEELSRHPDAIVLMPLLSVDDLYGPGYTGMNNVMQPLQHAADRVNIDVSRVYLMGHSTGANATWNLSLHYPTYFSAFLSLAGGANQEWQRLRLPNLRNVLPVAWVDAKDDVVKPELLRGVITALRNQKLDVDYQETKGLGHAPPDTIVQERYDKMRSHVRSLYPQWVTIQSNRPDVMFNRNDWVQLWQASDPGKESRIVFRRTGTHMTVAKNSARIDAKRDGNTIELTLDNVESLRLYLNEQMVDLDKPLTIVINKKRTIQGHAKRSIEQMLNDQLFIGRGWRYYTAVLDIDVTDPGASTRPTTAPTTREAPHGGKIFVGPGA